MELTAADQALIGALRDGLPLSPEPYRELGARAGLDGEAVRGRISGYAEAGVLARFGVVVRHDRLGYTASAMVVWDVPDAEVDALGRKLAGCPGVGLSYRRDRHPPLWFYNLYAMIPGRSRDEVAGLIRQINEACGLDRFPQEALYTVRCCKIGAAAYGAGP